MHEKEYLLLHRQVYIRAYMLHLVVCTFKATSMSLQYKLFDTMISSRVNALRQTYNYTLNISNIYTVSAIQTLYNVMQCNANWYYETDKPIQHSERQRNMTITINGKQHIE